MRNTVLKYFGKNTKTQSVKAGKPIFQVGDKGEVMYILVEGQADVIVYDKVVESSGPGSIFGEMAIVDPEPRSASVIAKTDCRLIPVTQKAFLGLIKKKPNFAIDVIGMITKRLRRMNDRVYLEE
jgi:CRP-like cAMP-binding protein